MKSFSHSTKLLSVVLTLVTPFAMAVPAHAGFLDDIVKNAKESIQKSTQDSIDEAQKSVEDSAGKMVNDTTETINYSTNKTVNFATDTVNNAVNNVNSTVNSTVSQSVDNAIATLQGHSNPIASLGVEGILWKITHPLSPKH